MSDLLEMPSTAVSTQLEAVIAPFAESGSVPGAVVLVADHAGTLAEAAVGYADIAQKRPLRTDSLFWVASQTKPITAAAVMILVDEARIDLDDPVEKYLPEFGQLWVEEEADDDHMLLKRPVRPVTVRDLLCHMSGMPFRSAMEEPTIDRLTLTEVVRSYVMTPLRTHPGKEYLYSNTGFNTAGRVVEVVSGVPFEGFIEERLLKPLKMSETTFRPDSGQLNRLAKCYRPCEDGTGYSETNISYLHYPLDDPGRRPVPGGGLFSTASDMMKFLQMILNRGEFEGTRILSAEAVEAMTRKQTPPEIEVGYGLGWAIDAHCFGHGGACGTEMKVYPERGILTLFLVQHEGLLESGRDCSSTFDSTVRDLFQV